jgi:hypothetical protein
MVLVWSNIDQVIVRHAEHELEGLIKGFHLQEEKERKSKI